MLLKCSERVARLRQNESKRITRLAVNVSGYPSATRRAHIRRWLCLRRFQAVRAEACRISTRRHFGVLTPRLFNALVLLVEHPGELLEKDLLLTPCVPVSRWKR